MSPATAGDICGKPSLSTLGNVHFTEKPNLANELSALMIANPGVQLNNCIF